MRVKFAREERARARVCRGAPFRLANFFLQIRRRVSLNVLTKTPRVRLTCDLSTRQSSRNVAAAEIQVGFSRFDIINTHSGGMMLSSSTFPGSPRWASVCLGSGKF